MSLKCPVCRALVEQGPHCRRCRANLTMLFTIEEQRAGALSDAGRSLQAGRFEEARCRLDEAEKLRPGPEVQRLRALLLLLQRDFVGAWKAHAAARAS